MSKKDLFRGLNRIRYERDLVISLLIVYIIFPIVTLFLHKGLLGIKGHFFLIGIIIPIAMIMGLSKRLHTISKEEQKLKDLYWETKNERF